MNSSSQTYKDLALPFFKETFDCIDEIMKKINIPYYLIGANSIALQFLKEKIKPGRATKDIDFAVMLSSLNEYKIITSELEMVGFRKVEAPWTFYSYKFDVVIDVLPFGEIEEKHSINFNERFVDLHVLGFREVMEDAIEVQIEEKIVNIPPLPGMVILKLIAWSDRPEQRQNDLSDILKIIQHYFDLEWDEIVELHYDILINEPFDRMKIAAEVLGRKSRQYLERSDKISERVLMVLQNDLQKASQSMIAREWARILDKDIQYAFELLTTFQEGITREP